MADMDLDDLDGPSRVPSRTSRFAPKNSKLKPKSESQQLNSFPAPPPPPRKKEEVCTIHDCETTNHDDCAVKMDVEPKLEDGQETKDETMAEVDDEDGDRVVREIDVFFTPQIDPRTQLYVLQYPLRPCWRPYEMDERCEEVRIKPSTAEVEVDFSIDVDSKNYDSNADHRVRMTKQTLSSSTLATGFAVGVLIGNKLHINPIRAVVQLRPSMEHLNSGGSKKNIVTCNVEASIKLKDVKDEKSAGPSKKLNKLPGTVNGLNDDVRESWMALKYHSSKSDYSMRYLRKMEVEESAPIQFSMSPYDYVSSLCPGVFHGNNKSQGPSIRS